MKRFKAGSVPLAAAASILVHVVLFGAFQAGARRELPERECYEVTLEYVSPLETPAGPAREKPGLTARLVLAREDLPQWKSPPHADTLPAALSPVFPEALREPAVGTLSESATGQVPEEGVLLVAVADAGAAAPVEARDPSRAAEGADSRVPLDAEPAGPSPGVWGKEKGTIVATFDEDTGGEDTGGEDAGGDIEAPGTDPNLKRINEELSRRIDRRKVYPPAARKRGIQGTVVCRLEVDRGGNLVGLNVVESSGSRVLDDAAVGLLERVFPISNNSGTPLTLKKAVRYSLVE